MSKIDMDKLCEGCLTYERTRKTSINKALYYDECTGYIEKDINCPCITCLIKMMCTDVCKKYRERI